ESVSCGSPFGLYRPRSAGRGRRDATGFLCGRAVRRARVLAAAARAAAVLGEITDQRVHRLEVCAVVDEAALLSGADQSRMRKLFQMERQRGGRDVEVLGDAAGREPCGSLLDQQPEYRQARLLREGGERLSDR